MARFFSQTWCCSGSLWIVPCSRVGHVFRTVIPYSFPPEGAASTLRHNSVRLAEIWLGRYKYVYYATQVRAQEQQPGLLRVMWHCVTRANRKPVNSSVTISLLRKQNSWMFKSTPVSSEFTKLLLFLAIPAEELFKICRLSSAFVFMISDL